MRVHLLGIGGTFMAPLALLARELGLEVSGADRALYPPMSELLAREGIPVAEGYDPAHLEPPPDLVVIGNALSRGNPAVEAVLDRGLPYTSGPAFLAERVLAGRWVLAVAGTHGKTTTTALLAWILEQAGLAPGFLVGGQPLGFPAPSRLGEGPFFVVEADEYDSAFFDKRSKFLHYRPRTLILNNLEHDHADIFPDLAAIETQCHHLLRTVPSNGLVILPEGDEALERVLARGCWTPVERFAADRPPLPGLWTCRQEGERLLLAWDGEVVAEARPSPALAGAHMRHNLLAAVAAARHAGVPPAVAAAALEGFPGVRRRLEHYATVDGIRLYDDFAHHPTAVAATLGALRARLGPGERLVALLEPRSNSMRLGLHRERLAPALEAADLALVLAPPGLPWDVGQALAPLGPRARVFAEAEALAQAAAALARPGDHLVLMSNGSFAGLHRRLEALLRRRAGGPAGEGG
ncbi:MAG: UDP-N-acetylmuramate:L-alanyl-gamma-D-glutamyl-meso-diaminopimelate ligase [Gammaproteobacteria bacterium]|nr:MAG: UDP-N-acetylmuramate:L-alanyl-gamma-D-glutamyl-meso-diaminopimelate ligase [Gammaproteobacteria bacterium]